MSENTSFEDINEAKANLDDIYNQTDPRGYFKELEKFDYSIPENAKPIFKQLISRLQGRNSDIVTVLDVGCSYGVNAALLKHDLSMSELNAHWLKNNLTTVGTEDVVANDQSFFANDNEAEQIKMLGLDQAENAIAYAEEVGLLDAGFALDLETQPLPATASREFESVDLLVSTGCVGYVTEKTFARLLPAVSEGRDPWIANFVLRMFPFDGIANTLHDWGYVTEKMEGETFMQRQFASAAERDQVLGLLRDQDIDPQGKETEGYLHAEFYLSRPQKDAEALPLDQLLVY